MTAFTQGGNKSCIGLESSASIMIAAIIRSLSTMMH